jgi:hypothetical protein
MGSVVMPVQAMSCNHARSMRAYRRVQMCDEQWVRLGNK